MIKSIQVRGYLPSSSSRTSDQSYGTLYGRGAELCIDFETLRMKFDNELVWAREKFRISSGDQGLYRVQAGNEG